MDRAGVAQLAEQLSCKQQVAGSTPVSGSVLTQLRRRARNQKYSGSACQTQASSSSPNTSGQDKATPWDSQRSGQ